MVSIKQKRQMMEYVSSKFDPRLDVEPCEKVLIPGTEPTRYLKIGTEGLVLMIDREYPANSFKELYEKAHHHTPNNVGVVFFKDGKLFFRSAAERNYFKKEDNLSLKHYTAEQMQEMMLLRPEERFMVNRARYPQYYQPQSERLEEGIETFKFGAVRFDYSHINPSVKFRPKDTDSERLFLHLARQHYNGSLELRSGYLVQAKPAETQ